MKKQTHFTFCTAAVFLAAFILWTAAVQHIDVQAIAPLNSAVGFATVNRFFHRLTGVHMLLYTVTDWLGLVPFACAAGFACLGLVQWLKRKHLRKVDSSILLLGGFYLIVIAAYLFFEAYVVNYRPILISGNLEASYPSSTAMLTLCVMPTAIMQMNTRIRHPLFRRCLSIGMTVFTVFMVVGRLLSGVHWLTDIVGGILLSAGLVVLYGAAVEASEHQNRSI